METTHHLRLPLLEAAQAAKHITHNEALLALDRLVQIAVSDRDLRTPPTSAQEGDTYIISPQASGHAWGFRPNQIAAFQGGAWHYYAPRPGWLAFVIDESLLVCWTGDAWGRIAQVTV